MNNPRPHAKVLQDVVAAGRAALAHLSRSAPKLRGIVLPTVVEAVATLRTCGLAIHSRGTLKQVHRHLTLARSRSRSFWRGIQSLSPRVDVEQELEPLESVVNELARMTTARHAGGRLGPLRAQLDSYRQRLEDLLTRIEEEQAQYTLTK